MLQGFLVAFPLEVDRAHAHRTGKSDNRQRHTEHAARTRAYKASIYAGTMQERTVACRTDTVGRTRDKDKGIQILLKYVYVTAVTVCMVNAIGTPCTYLKNRVQNLVLSFGRKHSALLLTAVDVVLL